MNPNLTNSLDDWLSWLQNQHPQEIHLGLERVSQVAQKMGLLHWDVPVISVAGTNGKGSSVAMLTAIYQAAGYQVGSYTSPHLLHYNERIQWQGKPVSDIQIIQAFDAIHQAKAEIFLSYFEFSTLAALYIFKQHQSVLDLIVLEVGLGGRLDAVNIIDADIALITAIDVDHIDWLGDDREKIGVEKAGIMRPNHPVVCSDINPPKSILKTAQTQSAHLCQIGVDFEPQLKNTQAWAFFEQKTILFDDLPLPNLKGAFQLQNAAGAIKVVHYLHSRLPVEVESIKEGLGKIQHPGRLQSLDIKGQHWWLDVAHNPQSAKVLAEYARQNNLSFDRVIFSALADKDCAPMVAMIKPFAKSWIIAEVNSPRTMHLSALKEVLLDQGILLDNIQLQTSVEAGVQLVLSEALKQNSVLVWGSFITVSQAIEVLINA